MNRFLFRQYAFVAFLLLGSLMLGGCTLFANRGVDGPPLKPQEMISAAYANSQQLDATQSDIIFHLDATVADAEGESRETAFDVNAQLAVDILEPIDPSFLVKAQLSGQVNDEKPLSGEFEIRVNKDNFFVILKSLEGLEDTVEPGVLDQLVAKWWRVPLPVGALNNLVQSLQENGPAGTLPEGYKELSDAITNGEYFQDVKYLGIEDLLAGPSYHYSMNLNDTFKAFFEEQFSQTENFLNPKEKAAQKALIESIDAEGEMWITVDGHYISRVVMAIGVDEIQNDEGEKIGNANVNFDVAYHKFDKALKLDEPEDATVFDPQLILNNLQLGGFGLGGQVPGGDLDGSPPEGFKSPEEEGEVFEY